MSTINWLPPQALTAQGVERRVGVEIEMAGLEAARIADCIQTQLGGVIERRTRYDFRVRDTQLGTFVVELDAKTIKTLGEHLERPDAAGIERSLQSAASDLLTVAAETMVPWELASPPVPMSQLPLLQELFTTLRNAGAKGTRSSMVYAFGLHLNPELPSLDVDTVLRYLRAFLCLYEWITAHDETDMTRRMSSYIDHFPKPYLLKVLDPGYHPDMQQFMTDYLVANPTRNRTLDLLPLFAFLNEPLVRASVGNMKVRSRPTLHYRLPNCDIDNPHWNLHVPWQDWLLVERLAAKPEIITTMSREYRTHLERRPSLESLSLGLDGGWKKIVERWWGGF